MKKVFLIAITIAFSTSFLFAWEIVLKPEADSSGRIAYGILCNSGSRVIVTYNTTQTYKPYYADGRTFESLNDAANYACNN